MNHQAIYNTHPNVVSIDDTAGCFDADGNPVAIDQSLVDEEVARLQADYDSKAYARARAEAYAAASPCRQRPRPSERRPRVQAARQPPARHGRPRPVLQPPRARGVVGRQEQPPPRDERRPR